MKRARLSGGIIHSSSTAFIHPRQGSSVNGLNHLDLLDAFNSLRIPRHRLRFVFIRRLGND